MINSFQDGPRASDQSSFSAMAHSAGMVSPNGHLCVTTATGSTHGDFSSRAAVTPPGAGMVATATGMQPASPRLPLI
jgi:hypothetical protein